MMDAICRGWGKEKEGNGLGDKRLRPRRSAIKAAFSADLGLKKADKLSGQCPWGTGWRNPSRKSAAKRRVVGGRGGRG